MSKNNKNAEAVNDEAVVDEVVLPTQEAKEEDVGKENGENESNDEGKKIEDTPLQKNVEEENEDSANLMKKCLDNPVAGLSELYNADIYIVSGDVDRHLYEKVDKTIQDGEQFRSTNAVVILCTPGGLADDAYKIARSFKRNYTRVTYLILGWCKSAGSLVALSGDQIIFGNKGELGPIDVQILKEDGFGRRESGLDYSTALNALTDNCIVMLDQVFLNLQRISGGTMSTKTGYDIATKIVVGMLSPISSQLDPLRLGEIERAIKITMQYGLMLGVPKGVILRFIHSYPSHGFTIDYEEANRFMDNVSMLPSFLSGLEDQLISILQLKNVKECIHNPSEIPVAILIENQSSDDIIENVEIEEIQNE